MPYFISSHPGCTLNNAIELAEFLRDIKHNPEQVQDFIPTPGSAATAMYYSGIDPESGETVFVARNPHDKAMQRALMQYRTPRNRKLVLEALQKAGRMDLVGSDINACCIRSRNSAAECVARSVMLLAARNVMQRAVERVMQRAVPLQAVPVEKGVRISAADSNGGMR